MKDGVIVGFMDGTIEGSYDGVTLGTKLGEMEGVLGVSDGLDVG